MKYLYVIHIMVYRQDDRIFMETAAALDIQAHQRLLPKDTVLVIAAPIIELSKAGVSADSLEEIKGVELIPLKHVDSFKEGIKAFRYNWRKLAASVASAESVNDSTPPASM